MFRRDKTQPLYMISVVAEMLGVHPQTLRLYEREGFVCPKRQNKQRLYSDEDIDKLNFILQLTRELGVNKAGVEIILRMRSTFNSLQSEIDDMMRYLDDDIRDDFRDRLKKIFRE